MSFQIAIPQNRRAAARFIGKVRRTLQRALADNPDIKRTEIADAIGVHRAVITRQLGGKKDISLGRVAELAWAMGYEPVFSLKRSSHDEGTNLPNPSPPATTVNVKTTSTTGSVITKSTEKPVEFAS